MPLLLKKGGEENRKSLTNWISDHAYYRSFRIQSYWARITSYMFSTNVGAREKWCYVRHDFWGQNFSWGPVRADVCHAMLPRGGPSFCRVASVNLRNGMEGMERTEIESKSGISDTRDEIGGH